MHARDSGNVRDSFDYVPVPPLAGTGYVPGEVYFWGYPEPFPFFSDIPWTPSRTRHEALYPLRHQRTLLVASCFGKKLEGTFPNVRGLSDSEYSLPVVDGVLMPARELVAAVRRYAHDERVRMRELPDYFRRRRRPPPQRRRTAASKSKH